MRCVLSSLLIVVIAASIAHAGFLHVEVNRNTGAYSVLVDQKEWLEGGDIAVRSAGTWYSTADSSLVLAGSSTSSGTDTKFGKFDSTTLEWSMAGGQETIIVETHFISYHELEMVIFRQSFPSSLAATASGDNNDVITAFPSFKNLNSEFNYFTLTGMFAQGAIGHWDEANEQYYPGGVESGPVAIYNQHLRTVILSPFNNFMVGSQTVSKHLGGQFACGVQGKVNAIPAGFEYDTILFAGQGITKTFYNLGDVLLTQYGKKRATFTSDVLIKDLGYWTDNGAYYYYITEPGKNYQQTMIDASKYHDSLNLPVKNYQFDSWWYYKGINDGVKLWEPRPDIFPNNMTYVYQQMGSRPLALHNRYFSPDNEYIKMGFPFAVEDYCALPLNEGLFTYIMEKAKQWGMVLYEQDWLIDTYLKMNATQDNVFKARNWMLNMGNAASKLDLTIQLCMPLPRHLLQSVESQSVSQSRASNDYNPGNHQWAVGHTNLFLWSLGLVPFKDDFWTTKDQPGCRYKSCVEPNPLLEVISATLTAGPIGFSDAVNKTNAAYVMATCNAAGLLLKADKPATPIEKTYIQFEHSVTPVVEELISSHSNYGAYTWHYIFGADLQNEWTIVPSDIGEKGKYLLFNYVQQKTQDWDATHPLTLPTTTEEYFSYYIASPVLPNGWVIHGEPSKFITMSKQRFDSFDVTQVGVKATLSGAPAEKVVLSVTNPLGNQLAVPCTIAASGRAFLNCSNNQCTCA